MRLFLASYLGPDAREAVSAEIAEVIAATGGVLRPVPAGTEHFTHAFLGESGRPSGEILEALRPVANIARFAIRIGGACVLRGRGRPRLVYLDVLEGDRDLKSLGRAIRDRLVPLFPALMEQRVNAPHITIARFTRSASRRDGRAVEALIQQRGATAWEAAATIGRVELVRSRLTPDGPIYETLGEIELFS